MSKLDNQTQKAPANILEAVLNVIWRSQLRNLWILLLGTGFACFAFWASLPDTVKESLVQAVFTLPAQEVDNENTETGSEVSEPLHDTGAGEIKILVEKESPTADENEMSSIKKLIWNDKFIFFVRTKSTYRGSTKNSLPDGYGRLSVIPTTGEQREILSYVGDFKNGMFHGKGTLNNYIKSPFDNEYLRGEFQYGRFIKGTAGLTYGDALSDRSFDMPRDGDTNWALTGRYEGDVSDSGEIQNSTVNSEGFEQYTYDYLNSLVTPNGKGLFKYMNEKQETYLFDGQWKKGAFTGNGVINLPNGGYQKGEFLYGKQLSGHARKVTFFYNWGGIDMPLDFSDEVFYFKREQ